MMSVSDPIRLAFRPPGSLAVPAAPDGGTELSPDAAIPIPGEMSFDELLQGLNPLHHLPGAGMVYRAVTGEEIHPVVRVLGAGLLGGPLGMALAGVMSAIEMTQPMERLSAALNGRPDPQVVIHQDIASRDVAGAYRRWTELASPARMSEAVAEATRLPATAARLAETPPA
ncbi:MAG: hypothetical protein JWR10_1984 [Rubritepida sp.]|nr:hypothetical protein [Rubritepida sp.]